MLLTASDSDIEISAEIHDNTFDFLQPVNLAVPGKKIFDICRSLPANDELSFELNGSWLTIQSGKSQFKLMSMPVEQFPTRDFADAEATLALPQNQVMHALRKQVLLWPSMMLGGSLMGCCLILNLAKFGLLPQMAIA